MTDWHNTIVRLLSGAHTFTADEADAGARLVVTDPDGDEVFRAALARHCRHDDEEDCLLWVRPIAPGDVDPSTGARVYNLNACRRRALDWTDVRVEGETVHLALESGQAARIEPANGEELNELRSWDAFTLGLSAEEERDLEALDGDSWWGQHS